MINNNSSTDYDVLIIGAGVGGSACALAFAHAYQLKVLVIERHPGPGNLNRGESLLPPVTALLKRWGALDRCYAAGALHMGKMQFFHHQEGMLLDVPLSLPNVSDPYLVLPHPTIECVLAEAAEATGKVKICYNTRLLRLIEKEGRVCGAVVRSNGEEEKTVLAQVVIGADGAKSAVREGIGSNMQRTRYNHSLFIIDVDRPPELTDVLRTELHPDGGILAVPGVGRLGLAALIRKEHEYQFHSGSVEEKFSHIAHRSPLLEGRRPSPVGVHLYKLWRGHAPHYSAKGAVLLGDAIHVINPVMAQGMTMAIEDAAALARHLGPTLEVHANEAELDSRFQAYEQERRPFNAAVIRRSHWMSSLFALGGFWGDIIHRRACKFTASPAGHFIQQRIWSIFATSPEVKYENS
jgi:2-polyprenyl-6-methoxyphenol hydroxylase-like FAD-dependent oxidoreductase